MAVELVDHRDGVSAGREKLRATALDLFADRGVSGTSLQMIADAMGVTKAAVYHHFRSKDEIVLAVVRPALDQLAEVAAVAESKRSRSAQVEAVIGGLADLVIENRPLYGLMQGDPTCAAILRDRSDYPALAERLMTLLTGPRPDVGALMAAGMLLAGLRGAGLDPRVTALDDEQFHRHLVDCSHRLLRPRRRPTGAAPSPAQPAQPV
ncbi:TetR family transcriptional regulator [Frankia sp. R43]|uniref:TetR/AcrR family transcriptional regulator n=1 Tax=Frankia sp. R43 TaxID=269536 RepID=UPI0006CA4564|nr:TetR/AcrR family transcriptional regulator [Frankia sp. R43]KPM55311.1 TetR family transcriptional regulator [Frankia sp. R43]